MSLKAKQNPVKTEQQDTSLALGRRPSVFPLRGTSVPLDGSESLLRSHVAAPSGRSVATGWFFAGSLVSASSRFAVRIAPLRCPALVTRQTSPTQNAVLGPSKPVSQSVLGMVTADLSRPPRLDICDLLVYDSPVMSDDLSQIPVPGSHGYWMACAWANGACRAACACCSCRFGEKA